MKLLLLLFLIPCAAFAQQAPERTCRILFLDGPDDAPEKLQLFDGAKCREVDLPRMNFSKVYQLPAGALRLWLLPAPPADPAKLPPGAPAVAVAEGVTDFYLLVTSDPANTVAPVRMQVINAGLATWPSPSPYAVPDGAQADNPGVTVEKGVPAGFDTVTLSVPQAPDTKKFARLKVTMTP